jgi:hypothetical protein
MSQGDRTRAALQSFKDWSNYLLVTTVAATGWIASDNVEFSSNVLKAASLWSLGTSILFGILTLSLIPLTAQQIEDTHESIYQVPVSFSMFGRREPFHAFLTQVCRPQHVAFLFGMLFLCLGTVGFPWPAWLIIPIATIYGLLSKPREDKLKKSTSMPDSS